MFEVDVHVIGDVCFVRDEALGVLMGGIYIYICTDALLVIWLWSGNIWAFISFVTIVTVCYSLSSSKALFA